MSNQVAPGNQPDPNPVEQFRRLAEPLRQFLNDWVPVFTPIVASIALLLGAVGLPSTITTQIAWIVLIAAALVATYFLWRWQKSRSRVPQRELQPDVSGSRARTAFRGLAGFQVGDQLPGEQRRREARTIFTQITDYNFTFGVLSGDTGAGKSSLARAELTKILEAGGYMVVLLPSPRQVFSKSEIDTITIGVVTKAINDWVNQKLVSPSDQIILLIDQFEEFFIQFRKTSERQKIAKLLRVLIDENKMKVICVIRRDYYLDFHDFAPEIYEPTSARNTFNLKNFEITEAANVIVECAGADGISISEPVALQIANDLADKGEVRPAELQIVCTALRGNFDIENYRLRGGAANILSHHVSQAIENSGDPKVARLILRALCDFAGNAKSQARDTKQLVGLVDTIERPNQLVEGIVSRILNRFVDERLVSRGLREGSLEVWSLMHDYLVEPIKIATQDASTRMEDAARALEACIRERRSSRHAVIPLGKLGEIRHYAPAPLLNSPEARRLIIHSYAVGYGRPASLVAAAVIATVGLVGWASLEAIWLPIMDERTRVGGGSFSAKTLGKGNVVLMAGSTFRTTREASFWAADTGKKLQTISGESMFYAKNYLIDVRKSEKIARIWNLEKIQTVDDVKNIEMTSINIASTDSPFDNYFVIKSDLVITGTQANKPTKVWIYSLSNKSVPQIYGETTRFGPLILTVNDLSTVIVTHIDDAGKYTLRTLNSPFTELAVNGEIITLEQFNEDEEDDEISRGRLPGYDNKFLLVTNINDKVSIGIYSLENNNIVAKQERSYSFEQSLLNEWNSRGNLIYNSGFGSGLFRLIRRSDLELLDERSKSDKWSGVIWPGPVGEAFQSEDGELRIWDEAGAQKRLKIGGVLDRGDLIVATKPLSFVATYSTKESRIDIWNTEKGTKTSVDIPELSRIEFERSGSEIVVSLPTASVELLSVNGTSLGRIAGIDGSDTLVTREYCTATIWTDRGQVLRVLRKWRAFGFLTFGRGGCEDAADLGK